MNENRYAFAGWLSISQAIIFPLVFVAGLIQGLLGLRSGCFTDVCCGRSEMFLGSPSIGFSDALFALLTAIGVYVYIMFRRYLNERYEFKDIDLFITLSIIWSITYFVGMTVIKWIFISFLPVTQEGFVIANVGFYAFSMVSIGVIDIFMAVHLLKKKGFSNGMLNAFAYVLLVGGVCEVTVFLSPLSLLLFPVLCVVLGITLLRANEEIEFV